jgi:hypothetical protein
LRRSASRSTCSALCALREATLGLRGDRARLRALHRLGNQDQHHTIGEEQGRGLQALRIAEVERFGRLDPENVRDQHRQHRTQYRGSRTGIKRSQHHRRKKQDVRNRGADFLEEQHAYRRRCGDEHEGEAVTQPRVARRDRQRNLGRPGFARGSDRSDEQIHTA